MPERLCRACGAWHSLDETWPSTCLSHFRPTTARSDLSRPMVISDLREYRAVAIDKRTGKRPVIDGRADHREFLRANNFQELGNDMPTPRQEQLSTVDRVMDIKRAIGD